MTNRLQHWRGESTDQCGLDWRLYQAERGGLMIPANLLALIYQWYVIRHVFLLSGGWRRQIAPGIS
jgi:hypothetical protein